MLFNKFFALSAISSLAAVTALPTPGDGYGDENVRCCEQVQKASDKSAAAVLGLLGIVVQDVNALVGLNCSPITVIGGGNGACSSTTVSCTDNSHGNLISLGCIPVTI
ncbi:fungal hydrophobin [Marasmius fiardii PR-910]|nr:fungal hydrophobin [Marasmius fiardii PR-910]